jgi:oligosaccharide repeat unit polymerase
VLAVLGSIAIAFLAGGRQGLLNVGIGIFLASYYRYGRVSRILMLVGSGVAILIILFGKSVLFQLTAQDYNLTSAEQVVTSTVEEGVGPQIVAEFSHQYLSLSNAVDRSDYELRYFGDLGYWSLKWLQLAGVDSPDSISYFNTYLTYGRWDSEIPPGMVANGYLQFGAPGVIILAFITGWLIRFSERLLAIRSRNAFAVSVYVVLCYRMAYLVSNSDPALFVQNSLFLIPLVALARLLPGRERERLLEHKTLVPSPTS